MPVGRPAFERQARLVVEISVDVFEKGFGRSSGQSAGFEKSFFLLQMFVEERDEQSQFFRVGRRSGRGLLPRAAPVAES